MKAQFEAAGFTQVELIASGGGVFEVTVGDELQYSKKALGRFPSDAEVAAMTKQAH
ncbi:MAG: Rdx family protein [Burkholderiaceae bacterium]